MSDGIKQTAEAVFSHPKATVLLTAAFTSNVWLDYGLPIVQGMTAVLGVVVLFLLVLKHATDLYKSWSSTD